MVKPAYREAAVVGMPIAARLTDSEKTSLGKRNIT